MGPMTLQCEGRCSHTEPHWGSLYYDSLLLGPGCSEGRGTGASKVHAHAFPRVSLFCVSPPVAGSQEAASTVFASYTGILQTSDSPNGAAPGSVVDMQILKVHSDLWPQKPWGWGPGIWVLTAPWVSLINAREFEKHCCGPVSE